MSVENYIFWAVLLFVGVVLPALPAILRAWRAHRQPDSFTSDKSANDPE